MEQTSISVQTASHKVGWWILFGISALTTVNHAALIFALPGEEALFIGWTASASSLL